MNGPMPRLSTLLVLACAVFASACTGVGDIAGGNVIPPEFGDPVVEIVVLAADDLGALPAEVVIEGSTVARNPGGTWTVLWEQQPLDIAVSAQGFLPFDYRLEAFPDGGTVEFRLEPVLLSGRITTDDGRPLPGSTVELNGRQDQTDNEGRYAIERAVPGVISIRRPAWQDKELEWDGGVDQLDIAMEQRQVLGIRASAEDSGDPTTWSKILELAESTAINAVVVDLKVADGTVTFPSTVPLAASSGAIHSLLDIDAVLADAQSRDLYTIGRVVVFQDDFAAAAMPDHAVTTDTGTLWRSPSGRAWLDPSDPASFEYAVAIAEEACLAGFDEIQFDHVSWPIGDLSDAAFDGEYNQEVRVAAVIGFLNRAYSVLHPRCAVSATVLGIVLESGSDEGVGQRPSAMSRTVDVLSPTLYTTNYGSGWKNWENPNEHAVELVSTALAGGGPKLDGFAYLRPWLQTWGISESDQRAVQSAVVEDEMGFLLWSNNANYSLANLPPR